MPDTDVKAYWASSSVMKMTNKIECLSFQAFLGTFNICKMLHSGGFMPYSRILDQAGMACHVQKNLSFRLSVTKEKVGITLTTGVNVKKQNFRYKK